MYINIYIHIDMDIMYKYIYINTCWFVVCVFFKCLFLHVLSREPGNGMILDSCGSIPHSKPSTKKCVHLLFA